MKQMNLGLAAPNLVCICVDNVKDNRIEGRIYHYYTEQPEIIKDTMQLLRILEAFYDRIDFPQAAEQLREFVNDSAEVKRRKQLPKPVKDREFLMKQDENAEPFCCMCSIAKMPPGRGRLCGRRRKNSGISQRFLELLVLLDNALAAYKE